MASIPIHSSRLGVHESQINEPSPLRIFKHSRTLSSSSTFHEPFSRRVQPNHQSFDGKESPPLAKDRPLTVRKLRKDHKSTTSERLERYGDSAGSSAMYIDRTCRSFGDNDDTPKAQHPIRGVSTGTVSKSEFIKGRHGPDFGYHSLRIIDNMPDKTDFHPLSRTDLLGESTRQVMPRRRLSKSRNFFLRALGGTESDLTKPAIRDSSATSRNTLIRRVSQRRGYSFGSQASQEDIDEDCVGNVLHSLHSSTSKALGDGEDPFWTSQRQRQATSTRELSDHSTTSQEPHRMLYPHIIVTPESSSIDAGLSVMWVAISVTGVLQDAAGNTKQPCVVTALKKDEKLEVIGKHVFDMSVGLKLMVVEANVYGRLHSMRIDLHPGQDCSVLQIVGNLHESKTILAGQTELILAKIRIGQVRTSIDPFDNSAEGLMAELQNHLGEMVSSYLTVRLTYKHSGFPNQKPLDQNDGMKLRMTRIDTEATATIKRRNAESAWSPRTSGTLSDGFSTSLIIHLIDQHFTPEKALEVKKLLIDDRSPVSIARKFGFWADRSEPETKDGLYYKDRENHDISSILSDHTSLLYDSQNTSSNEGVDAKGEVISSQFDDVDPARKIWGQMRLTSRGGGKRHIRSSISASHHTPTEEDGLGVGISPNVIPSKRLKSKSTGTTETTGEVGEERGRIVEAALRNKRSVGAETLKSIAPSVATDEDKSKRTSITGLGVGKAWGWAPAWW